MNGYDKHGRKIYLIRPYMVDPDVASMEEMMRVHMMQFEVLLKSPDLQSTVKGLVILGDSGKSTLRHIKRFSPPLGKKMITIFQDAFPNRPQELHMLNVPGFVESVLGVIKSFMNDKMRERMNVHSKGGGYEALYERVGKEVLPEEYGGMNGPIQDHIDAFKKLVYENGEWLKKQEKMKSNETKRKPGMHKSYSDVFGMEGSFRQLAFD